MPRFPFESEYLYGLHDAGGESIMLEQGAPGWVVVTTAIGHNPHDHSGQDFSFLSARGLGVMVRLNNGYSPAGTLPLERDYDDFARRCANFVQASQGAHIWIIGNEPNHPIEWPEARWDWNTFPPHPLSPDTRGEPITPARYAAAYLKARSAIHALPGHEQDLVLVAAVAPWNTLTPYPGNEKGDWVQYFADVLQHIGAGRCDGITLHTYTHGPNPDFITSEAHMAPPFADYHWHFRAYRDFMNAIPPQMRSLPVYITETDQGDGPWVNANTGWVQQAYQEIDDWNRTHAQKIRSLVLYRWSRADKWSIEDKPGVIADFRAALAHHWKWTAYGEMTDLGDFDQQLTELEAQKASLQAQIDAALFLGQKLEEEIRDLEAARAPLSQAAEVQDTLEALAREVAEIERELARISPPISAGAVPRPPVQDVSSTLPQHAEKRWPQRPLHDIQRIVIHYTRTAPDISPEELARRAVARNKPGLPYHFLITGDGSIYQTQPLTHLVQQNLSSRLNQRINADSIAIALAGDFRRGQDVEPSAEQIQAAAALIAWLISRYHLGSVVSQVVFGRNELGEKVTSPGDQWLTGVRWKDKLISAAQSILDQATCDDQEQVQQLQQQIEALQAEVERLKNLASQGAGKPARPPIIDVVDSLPRHPTLPPYSRRTEPIRKIIIHHTDTPTNMTVEQIARYHVFGSSQYKDPWPGIGYHYVIAPDGTIYWTQRHETRSYHVGAANNYSLGVSLIGRFMQKNYDGSPRPPQEQLPTPAQLDAAARLVAWLMDEVNVQDIEDVVGHKEVGITACPGDQWLVGVRWKDDLHRRIMSHRGGKPLEFYLLFWDHGHAWAQADWQNAQDYIAHFRPTTGFSVLDAMQARHVLIVGGVAGVSQEDEDNLRAAGCDVHRLAGANEAETKAMLADLIAHDTPWPEAEPVHSLLYPQASPKMLMHAQAIPSPDAWTVPDSHLPLQFLTADTDARQRLTSLIDSLADAHDSVAALPAQIAQVQQLLAALQPLAEQGKETAMLAANLKSRVSHIIATLERMLAVPQNDYAAVAEALLARARRIAEQLAALEPQIESLAATSARVLEISAKLPAQQQQAQNLAGLQNQVDDLLARARKLQEKMAAQEFVPPPGVQDVRAAMPHHPTLQWPTRPLSQIKKIIVHHTVTSPQTDPFALARATIDRRRLPGVTYHFLVRGDGSSFWLEPLTSVVQQTLHEDANASGVAVALAGNFTTKVPPQAQLEAAARIIAALVRAFGLDVENDVIGRNEIEMVGSPGKQWLQGARYKMILLEKVRNLLAEG